MTDQALDCANPKACNPRLPLSAVISGFREPGSYSNTDCSTNMLLLIDNPGKVNVEDTASADWLSETNRVGTLSTMDEVNLHFTACQRAHNELKTFFTMAPVKNWVRSQGLVVAYWNAASESMAEAVAAAYTCFDCFTVVTHQSHSDDGATPYHDTDVQLELADWGELNQRMVVLPTHDYDNLKVGSDVASNAYKSKEAGNWSTAYVLTNDRCVNELDADCKATGNSVADIGNEHIAMAAVMTSTSERSSRYQFTLKFKPITNVGIPESATSALTWGETVTATGFNGSTGGLVESSPHHVNVYHNVDGYKMFMEGLTATGLFIADAMQRLYVKRALEAPVMELLANTDSVSLTDLTIMETTLTSVINTFKKQGFVSDNELDLSGITDTIVDSGNGWYLTRGDTTDTVERMMSPHYQFCYQRTGSTHFVSVGLCDSVEQSSITTLEA